MQSKQRRVIHGIVRCVPTCTPGSPCIVVHMWYPSVLYGHVYTIVPVLQYMNQSHAFVLTLHWHCQAVPWSSQAPSSRFQVPGPRLPGPSGSRSARPGHWIFILYRYRYCNSQTKATNIIAIFHQGCIMKIGSYFHTPLIPWIIPVPWNNK